MVIMSSRSESISDSKHTERIVEICETKASSINEDLLSPNDTLFELFIDVVDTYDTCGNCSGFTCFSCWRGVLSVLAYKNDKFYKHVKESNKAGSDIIDGGVKKYARYK